MASASLQSVEEKGRYEARFTLKWTLLKFKLNDTNDGRFTCLARSNVYTLCILTPSGFANSKW